jgi:hypothetical protein
MITLQTSSGIISQAWWCTHVIPAFRRLRQECELQTSKTLSQKTKNKEKAIKCQYILNNSIKTSKIFKIKKTKQSKKIF